MNEDKLSEMFKALNIIKNLEKITIDSKDVENTGYSNYLNFVYSIVNKCITELESNINIIDYMFKVNCLYKNWKICFIFKEYNLSKIYLTINNKNVDISINLNSLEIKIYLEYKESIYLTIKFKKDEKINNVVYIKKNNKIEKKTDLNNLYEIINSFEIDFLQKDLKFLNEVKDTVYELQYIFKKY